MEGTLLLLFCDAFECAATVLIVDDSERLSQSTFRRPSFETASILINFVYAEATDCVRYIIWKTMETVF
jgi:hypothetical protein